MNFGQRLKMVRLSLGLTQQEFADCLHTTKQAISRYENSEREPNLKTAKTFSDLLGIDLALLAGDEVYSPVCDHNAPALNDDERTLIETYHQATEDEKGAIRLILNKYSTSASRQKESAKIIHL